jgi:hypothetical protein
MLQKSENRSSVQKFRNGACELLLSAGRIFVRRSRSFFAGGGFFPGNSCRLQQLPNSFPACDIFLSFPIEPGFVPIDSRHS